MLHFQHQTTWILQTVFDAYQESNRLLTIDKAMIIAQCQIHHGANNDLTIERNWTLLDGVHTKDTTLWRVKNRSAQ